MYPVFVCVCVYKYIYIYICIIYILIYSINVLDVSPTTPSAQNTLICIICVYIYRLSLPDLVRDQSSSIAALIVVLTELRIWISERFPTTLTPERHSRTSLDCKTARQSATAKIAGPPHSDMWFLEQFAEIRINLQTCNLCDCNGTFRYFDLDNDFWHLKKIRPKNLRD